MGYGRPRGPSFPRVLALVGVIAAIAVVLLASTSAPAAAADGTFSATIQRDSHGIPHIEAADYAGLGFGYGYAFAEDNICTIADSYVTVRAQRSRYFEPDGSYQQRGNGVTANNLNSDVFFQRVIDKGIVEDLLDDPAPTGPAPEIREGVRGYVAGYNKYLADTGVENLTDPRCRGAEWVTPIKEIDAYRRFYQLALLASATVAINGIGSEKAPGADAGVIDANEIAAELGAQLPIGGIGSNAYALGGEATTNGKGIVLGNPHFPWDGPERFYQSHLTIPGEINVSGASLFGVPLVLIGHTENLAWSHTVSTAFRFTPFQETLNPADPTQYLYDGEFQDMTEEEVTVEGDPGTNADDVTRTVYSTHHGLVFTDLLGIPLPWTPVTAFAMGDVNAANFRYLNHFFEVNRAQSVRELDQIERTYQGIPWVNTIAADSAGEAYYADIGAIPNVSNEKASSCNTVLGAVTFGLLGLPVLDGSRSECEWDTDEDAVAPGIFGYDNLPKLFRDDYVTNSNDSYWLSNPEEPLTGYARIIGDESSPRELRTRLGLKMLIERFDDKAQPATRPLDRQAVQDLVFNNRIYSGELFRDQLVALCESAPAGFFIGSSGPVDVSGACPALAAWDLHDDLDSDGAVLFRRFATRLLAPIAGLVSDPTIYTTPFDAANAVETPSGLNVLNPKVQQALADAVSDLDDAGIPLDAPLRGYQYERRGDEKIPVHGGPHGVGAFNVITAPWVGSGADAGFPNVIHGSSFVMVTQFTDGCADDRSILTYSQSENPNSAHWADQNRMFSEKQWVDPAFCPAEIDSEPGITATTIESGPVAAKRRKCRSAKRGRGHRALARRCKLKRKK
jgi:acyl-homoserine-lactone acylase